jgi:hypothetical protein
MHSPQQWWPWASDEEPLGPTLKMRRLAFREVKWASCSHRANTWQGWESPRSVSGALSFPVPSCQEPGRCSPSFLILNLGTMYRKAAQLRGTRVRPHPWPSQSSAKWTRIVSWNQSRAWGWWGNEIPSLFHVLFMIDILTLFCLLKTLPMPGTGSSLL